MTWTDDVEDPLDRWPTLSLTLSLSFSTLALTALSLSAQEMQEPEPWDVDMSLGPSEVVRFETSEGTWMNVDVSPDGETLVFDLVGDLYTMPVEGGRATRITSGAAWDMQPRFSPQGDRIAFISDRGGVQNIWLVDPDGSDPVQVSEEDAREVNSPAWSTDGQYIFARKHYVDTRSLGAGEVWMYHRTGGGLQVTERNGFQKDQGEPAAAPGGTWMYYSQNVYPGQTFQYNKDVYQTIYAIRRHNLETGEEETVTSRPGGSITPRISPDGRYLSFIRRVRLESVLYLRDLETGEEWPLWDGLSRDMQEAWAIHGVYAQYDWLPDGTGIVIWAQGGLWRVDADTGDATRIPFTAPVEQTVHQALRYPVEVHPGSFRVKMLRHVTVSPDGGRVAYSALGKVWVKELPDGEPRRLTGLERIESHPAWSPDSRRIALATWDDVELGRIRVVDARTGRGRDVVSDPGHYNEPAFSPDGGRVVYRSVGGDLTRGVTHGENTGIFVVPADGSGEPVRVETDGFDPSFDVTGERVFTQSFRSGARVLKSVALDGTGEVVHFSSENAQDIVPSPDGRWVAWFERFRAYVAAFPRTGRTLTLGTGVRAFPAARVSDNAGFNLHWSGDSEGVHWSLGPELFTRELPETFAFVSGGDDEPAPPETEGTDISFTAESDVPEGAVAFTGGRIITMAGEDGGIIENGTLVVEGNRITAVGPVGDVEVPAGAHTVDVRGRTLMPGLVDAHAHVGGESSGILAESNWGFMANVAFGVTTSHDPSNDTETVFTNAEMIRAGHKLGPRLFSTGTILYGAETPFKAVTRSYEDALKHLERMKAVGAISVKSYNQRRRDSRQWIVQAARDTEMMVFPEGGSLFYNNMTMVLDGHTGVEHSVPVPMVYEDVVRPWAASGVGYTPTMVVGYGGLSGEYYWYERTNVWENERLLRFTPRDVVDPRSRRRLKAAGDDDFNHVAIAEGAEVLDSAGVLVNLGAHGQLQGLAAHWELWMFTHGGMTPVEALRAGTLNGAEYMGMDADIGSLEAGKLADLIVLGSNPLDDIRNTEDIDLVMLNGRLYDAELNQVGNHPTERPELWWERGRTGR